MSLLTHNTNRNLSLFPSQKLSFVALFKECRLSVITPWWASVADTGFALERHKMLEFQGEFSTQNYDNTTELVKNYKII